MKLNDALKKFAVETLGVDPNATDDVFRKAISAALISKKVTAKKLSELAGVKEVPVKPKTTPEPKSSDSVTLSKEDLEALIDDRVGKAVDTATKDFGGKPVTASEVFKAGANVRVKGAAERYDGSKKSATYPDMMPSGIKHPMAGMPARIGETGLDTLSKRDKAIAGVFFKWQVSRQMSQRPGDVPSNLRMTSHERELLLYALKEQEWVGLIGGDCSDYGATKVNRRMLREHEVKALLDDGGASGGMEVVPIAFDDMIITIPVLYGELFPFVNLTNISRGRRIEGASMLNPTITSGTAEGTAIDLFNTASFISAFDTTIRTAVGAFEIGLDFESDSPVDIASKIMEAYGYKMLEWLDRVIAYGDGTTEPLGIFQTTGINTTLTDNGVGGPPTISDLEGLMFGIDKAYRFEAGATNVFLSNDTHYRRCRGIPVGDGDQRRVMGMDYGDYKTAGWPHKIQNSIPNGRCAAVNLKRYRMYRRLGMQMRVITDGKTLGLTNTELMVLRARFGGQMETGEAACAHTDGQV